jgi:DNA-binding NarL/FixJ family response regulator
VEKVRVGLLASDPLSYAGLASYLESRSTVVLLPGEEAGAADVVVTAAERPSRAVLNAMREPTADFTKPVVFVTEAVNLGEAELVAAVRCRVLSILPRAAVTGDQLVNSVLAVTSGAGVMTPTMVGDLLTHIRSLQDQAFSARGPIRAGLLPREVDVLRLVADGMDTAEIAGKLCYSERTVKNVIHGVTGRLKLRNRSHAVAYAFRSGVI